MNNILYKGTEFSIICPDSFNEEYTRQRFMLITDDVNIHIVYLTGLKKGWIKWWNIPKEPKHIGVNIQNLRNYLIAFYKDIDFDINTFQIENK